MNRNNMPTNWCAASFSGSPVGFMRIHSPTKVWIRPQGALQIADILLVCKAEIFLIWYFIFISSSFCWFRLSINGDWFFFFFFFFVFYFFDHVVMNSINYLFTSFLDKNKRFAGLDCLYNLKESMKVFIQYFVFLEFFLRRTAWWHDAAIMFIS